MAMELVTGHTGSAHVSSADAAALYRGIVGEGTMFLNAVPEISMTDANTFSVTPFDVVSDGYHSRSTTGETVTIQSGAQTGFRKDAIMLRYENDGVEESASLVYVAGETASTEAAAEVATTPYVGPKVSEGADIVDVPLFVITLDGLTPTAAFAEGIDAQAITSLAALRDSVSHVFIMERGVTESVVYPAKTAKSTKTYLDVPDGYTIFALSAVVAQDARIAVAQYEVKPDESAIVIAGVNTSQTSSVTSAYAYAVLYVKSQMFCQ